MLRLQWAVVAAILCCSGIVLSSCNDSSENMTSDLTPLAAWQAGKVKVDNVNTSIFTPAN